MNTLSKGRLVDHTDCWHELCALKRERDDLRFEVARLRAALASGSFVEEFGEIATKVGER